jgi:hypothetical protein
MKHARLAAVTGTAAGLAAIAGCGATATGPAAAAPAGPAYSSYRPMTGRL